jgi:hypothetical protein
MNDQFMVIGDAHLFDPAGRLTAAARQRKVSITHVPNSFMTQGNVVCQTQN